MTTTQKLTPCLWFDDQAEQAANFYCSIFPSSRIISTVPYPEGAPGPAGSVMLVEFELDGQRFTGLNGGPLFNFTEAVSFQIECKDQTELDYYWDALTAGGEESQCGWLKDKFGLSWQVVPSEIQELMRGEPARIEAAMQAMLGMKKIDIGEMKRAYASA